MKSGKQKQIIIHGDIAKYKFYSQTSLWYNDLIEDISCAKQYVYIETFRIGNDFIGQRLCNALTEVHRKGVRVKVLADWWGTGLNNEYVNQMANAGVEVRFFKKFILSLFLFSKNHRRDHRKIVVIDNEISHIGSANFTAYSMAWRESILRIEGQMSRILKKIFYNNFKIYNKDISLPLLEKSFRRTIKYNDFFFIRDVPSVFSQRVKKNYIRLIQNAKHSITIETPYFLPGRKIYSELLQAVKRGVKVNLIMPKSSDVKIVDFLRITFLDNLYKKGVNIYFYKQGNLHSKLLYIDDELSSIGSSNIDHRSFKYMFELVMISYEPTVCKLVGEHIQQTMQFCDPFDMEVWHSTSVFKRLIALILLPFSHLL